MLNAVEPGTVIPIHRHPTKDESFVVLRGKVRCTTYKDDGSVLPMTQDERWNKRYQDVMDFMEKNHRNPSRHRLEEHDMLNWVKQQRKLKNKGELKAERTEMLERLLSLWERYKHVNQYVWFIV